MRPFHTRQAWLFSLSNMSATRPPAGSHEKPLIEYFAGIGLFRMGLEPLGWRVVLANDFSPSKRLLYEGFFPGASSEYDESNIFDLDPSKLPRAMLATAGFPCIDLSLAGNRKGVVNGEHSSAFWGLIRVLAQQGEEAPPIIVLENVPGWLSSNGGEDFRITVEALSNLGYGCDVVSLDARRFTPQSRLRVFLVGARYSGLASSARDILARPPSLATLRLKEAVLANPDLRWRFPELPDPPALVNEGLSTIVERLPADDPRWWSASEVSRHLAMMTGPHRSRVLSLKDRDTIAYRTFFRRRRGNTQRSEVREGDTAGCLRTAVGGSSRQFLVAAGLGTVRMRTMTPREYARLQGVPDTFTIVADDTTALTGLGDAVCVPAVTWIGRHLVEPAVVERQRAPDRLPARAPSETRLAGPAQL